jgi:hypothetical protein
MSKIKDTIAAILKKHKVNLSVNEIKMAVEGKTSDGKTLGTPADAWDAGVECYIVGEDGTPTAAPAGEYVMEDGSTVVVGDDGKVAEIKAKAEESMTEEELAAVVDELAKKASDAEAALATVTAQSTAATAELATVKAELAAVKAENGTLKTQVVALSKKAAPEKVDLSKEKPAGDKPESTRDRVLRSMNAAN